MYIRKLYEAGATDRRVRYAITNILRDRVVNEGAFRVCFQMDDEDAVIRTILRRGLNNQRLRTALGHSHLVDITHWLTRYPDLAEAYYGDAMLQRRRSRGANTKTHTSMDQDMYKMWEDNGHDEP
jgi:hypothetical protein